MPQAKSARPTVVTTRCSGRSRPDTGEGSPVFGRVRLIDGVKSCKSTRITAGQVLEEGLGRPLRWSALATALFVPEIAARRPPLEHHGRIPRGRGERVSGSASDARRLYFSRKLLLN
jgi:hypothetical protein